MGRIINPMQKTICLALLMSISFLSSRAQDTSSYKKDFKPSGKISGYLFGDYAYKLHADEQQRGNIQYSQLPKDYNAFNIRRIYLGYDYQFSPKVSAQLILAHESSSDAISNNTDALTDDNRSVYVKYANIQLKDIVPRATIVFGQQATPTFARMVDKVWGYRSIEKSITDMRGISSSTDLGLGLYGRIGKGENLGYDILVGNNNGAKLENDKFKKIYTSLYTYLLDKKLLIQVNYEHNRKITVNGLREDDNLYKAFASYKTGKSTIGIEAFRQTRTHNAIYTSQSAPLDTVNTTSAPSGLSVFYTQEITPEKLNFFARIDFYNPDTKYKSNHTYLKSYSTSAQRFATIGLDFIPYKNIHVMPNIWYNHFHSKLTDVTGSLKNDHDLVGRITVYFLFNK